MKLVFCVMCVTLMTGVISDSVVFEKPRSSITPTDIPKVYGSISNATIRAENYPLAIEAVLSVALKLQAIDDLSGRIQNFLVSPLAVAGALGELMLGSEDVLQEQIGILLTLRNDAYNNSTQPHVVDNPGRVQQRLSDFTIPSSAKGSGSVASLYGTITPANAENYQVRRSDMPRRQFPVLGQGSSPGLELHQQLGSLIDSLSQPLREKDAINAIVNQSYLHTSSAFFVDQKLNLETTFVHSIKDFYNSNVKSVDFSGDPVGVQTIVNNWGATETGGLIKRFLTYPPPQDTAVIQAVAVHFRGAWQTPFIPEGTIPGLFKTSNQREVPVKFMRGTFEGAYYAENPNLHVRLLILPYSSFECGMYVILPTESNPFKFNISHMVSLLSSKHIADLTAMAKQRTVNVMFPKLSLTGSVSIVEALEKHAEYLNNQRAKEATSSTNNNVPRTASVSNSASARTEVPVSPSGGDIVFVDRSGLGSPLPQSSVDDLRVIPLNTPQSSAKIEPRQAPAAAVPGNPQVSFRNGPIVSDPSVNSASKTNSQRPMLTLTKAATDSKFRISDIIQQIALEVNEAGTEAAAIVGSTVNYSGDVKNFKVNRPFLFFIRHEKSNALLFWGTIVDPTA